MGQLQVGGKASLGHYSPLGQGQGHLPLEGPFFMQKYLHIKKNLEDKSTFCSQPFSIPLPAPGEIWMFNSGDFMCLINCCSIPRPGWAVGLIYCLLIYSGQQNLWYL